MSLLQCGAAGHCCPCPFPDLTEEDNHMGWFCVEDDGNQVRKEKHPLLVARMPVTVAKQQEFKVTGQGPRPAGGERLARGGVPVLGLRSERSLLLTACGASARKERDTISHSGLC